MSDYNCFIKEKDQASENFLHCYPIQLSPIQKKKTKMFISLKSHLTEKADMSDNNCLINEKNQASKNFLHCYPIQLSPIQKIKTKRFISLKSHLTEKLTCLSTIVSSKRKIKL